MYVTSRTDSFTHPSFGLKLQLRHESFYPFSTSKNSLSLSLQHTKSYYKPQLFVFVVFFSSFFFFCLSFFFLNPLSLVLTESINVEIQKKKPIYVLWNLFGTYFPAALLKSLPTILQHLWRPQKT